jgi:hypothetical protein
MVRLFHVALDELALTQQRRNTFAQQQVMWPPFTEVRWVRSIIAVSKRPRRWAHRKGYLCFISGLLCECTVDD